MPLAFANPFRKPQPAVRGIIISGQQGNSVAHRDDDGVYDRSHASLENEKTVNHVTDGLDLARCAALAGIGTLATGD